MNDPLTLISTRRTPQSEQADPRQEKNAAGGYTFVVDDLARLHRFLTIGSTGGTFYVGEKDHTVENGQLVLDLARTRPLDVVAAVREVSVLGRAPKQNQSLFALAAAAKLGGQEGATAAYAAVPEVVRTASHLFLFVSYAAQFGGWGNGLARAVARWYLDRDPDNLAYQILKYRHRNDTDHAALLRQAHPFRWTLPGPAAADRAVDVAGPSSQEGHRALFDWVLAKKSRGDKSQDRNHNAADHRVRHEVRASGRYRENLPRLVGAFEQIQAATSVAEVIRVIEGNRSVSWEMVPDRFINEPTVWMALLTNGVPMTALIRQLPRLTNIGVIKPLSAWTSLIAEQLTDADRLTKARVHPIAVLIAQRTYASGISPTSDTRWTPNQQIVDALDRAFYAAYGAVEPSDKRTMYALDASYSMTHPVAGVKAPLSCREAAAALMLVSAATSPNNLLTAFTADQWLRDRLEYDGRGLAHFRQARLGTRDLNEHAAITPLAISPRQRLDDVLKVVQGLPWAGTDCSLPMQYALREGLEVDTFVTLTDNETWYGKIHPHQALEQYRRETGIPARLVVVSMTATGSTIADPLDTGTLDIAGFDAAVPNLISDFSRGL